MHIPRFRLSAAAAACGLGALALAAGPAAAEPSFRVRADLAAPLDADAGWAAGPDEEAIVVADRPFRIRFDLEWNGVVPGTPGIALQFRRNDDEDWYEVGAHDFPYPHAEEPRSPRLSVVRTPAYVHGEPTIDLLAGAAAPFAGGVGINLAAQAPAWFPRAGHLELEWPLVVRRWADGPVTNEEGDRFEVRLADDRGEALPGQRPAAVRLTIPPGHLGGTFVETPGRIGPWQASDGSLYFVMEPTESDNRFLMVKSTDGGRSWREVDGAHRPRTGDLESVDGHVVGDTIVIAHQVTEAVLIHRFRTSDHPTAPDTWESTDEVASTDESIAQSVSMIVRPDGTLETYHVGPTVYRAVRAPDGTWGPSAPLVPDETRILAGPQAILDGRGHVVVAFWREDGTIRARRVAADGTLGPDLLLAEGAGLTEDEYGSVLPLVHLPASDAVAVVFRLADGFLWERRILPEGLGPLVRVSDRPVANHVVDAQQPAADVVADGGTLHVLFVDDETRSLRSTHDRGGWQPSVERVAGIRGSWVRAAVHDSPAGARVLRYVYDAGSTGGTGMNRFGSFEIEAR